MTRLISTFVLTVAIIGCAGSSRTSLDDINPVRTYNSGFDEIYEATREFCVREAYIVDRFEKESATIIAHKVFGGSAYRQDYTMPGAANRVVIMHLKFKRAGAGKTQMTAKFSFGGGQVSATRDDESLLADNYNGLFSFLAERVPVE